jgi:hypothetical protein
MAQRTIVIVDCDRCKSPDLKDGVHLLLPIAANKKEDVDLCAKCAQMILQSFIKEFDFDTSKEFIDQVRQRPGVRAQTQPAGTPERKTMTTVSKG